MPPALLVPGFVKARLYYRLTAGKNTALKADGAGQKDNYVPAEQGAGEETIGRDNSHRQGCVKLT
jgi:hypothetical protein